MAAVERQSQRATLLVWLHPALCLLWLHPAWVLPLPHPLLQQPQSSLWSTTAPQQPQSSVWSTTAPQQPQALAEIVQVSIQQVPSRFGVGNPFSSCRRAKGRPAHDHQCGRLAAGRALLGACMECIRKDRKRHGCREVGKTKQSFVVHHTLNKPELFCHPQNEWEYFFLISEVLKIVITVYQCLGSTASVLNKYWHNWWFSQHVSVLYTWLSNEHWTINNYLGI